jgi:Winged helix DNA-binding domain
VTTAPTLSDPALNRATLARQHLLERVPMAPYEAVEALVGLQAQTTRSWYLTLWSRLVDFDPIGTGRLLEERRLVRMTALRGTIHLITDADGPTLRAFTQPAITRLLRGTFGRRLTGVDLDELERIVRDVVGDEAVALDAIAEALAARWPDTDRFALAQAGRAIVPLVHAPPRGVWGQKGPVRLARLDRWLGRPPPVSVDMAQIVRRYLAAYGPGSVADARAWSGVTGLSETFEALRPELVSFRDERGRELFDLPDAPRPDADTPAPVRFLADYDNVLLAHADRSRFGGEAEREALAYVSGPIPGLVLVDGRAGASWHIRRDRDAVAAVIQPVVATDPTLRQGLETEALGVLGFLEPGAARHAVEVLEPIGPHTDAG